MSITTLDGVLAGMQPPQPIIKAATGTLVVGRPHSLFYTAGMPGAAVAPSPGINGASLTTYAGQVPFSNPVSGNTYLARLQAQATIAGTLMLCDRLWHNSAIDITATTAQGITSTALPARDMDAAIAGRGIMIGAEVSTVTGAGTPTISISYTNSLATAGKTGVNTVATVASSIAGTFYPIGLAAGDVGVKSVESLTLSETWTSGTIHLVAYRILAQLELTGDNIPNAIDALTGGFPKLHNNTVPFLVFIPSATTSSNIVGQVIYSQG